MEIMKIKQGFTLAEVLITLTIIGVIAAITVPTLNSKLKDYQFRVAYKKSYSDINNAFKPAIARDELTRTSSNELSATTEEFNIMKNAFKVIKVCEPGDLYSCWAQGDTVCGGSCSTGNPDDGIDIEGGNPRADRSYSFIDASGRSWATYSNTDNLFLVDTNGFKGPNLFGKDRFMFIFMDKTWNRTRNAKEYTGLGAYYNSDKTTQNAWCKHPPCYYKSWLK